MKTCINIFIVLFVSLSLLSCSDDPTGTNTENPEEVVEASAEKQFVWNAMNYWYYWQGEVPELRDGYPEEEQDFHDYLKSFESPEALFNELTYDMEDDFSFFIDDYEEFNQNQQGITFDFGYEFGLVRMSSNSNEVIGYVQYVLEGSPAEENGLMRGDIFTRVDGTQLTTTNYTNLLQGKDSYELTLAEIENDTLSETGESVTLESVTIQEDPVHITQVIEEGSSRIGYLMYNAFQLNSHGNLNEAFSTFQSEGIDELVVDLRYNGGGTGITSQLLGSLISGQDSSNVFATYEYNEKRESFHSRSVNFLAEVPIYEDQEQVSEMELNTLSLDRIYFLTGFGTASASEMLINALEPYIEVIVIGGQTVGKDEGSLTLYDSPQPYLNKDEANPDHKMAIQPIVLKLVNSNGQDYPEGLQPDHPVNEVNYLEDLPPLGERSDPLLSTAIEQITGQPVAQEKLISPGGFTPGEMLIDSRDLDPYKKHLYLQHWQESSPQN